MKKILTLFLIAFLGIAISCTDQGAQILNKQRVGDVLVDDNMASQSNVLTCVPGSRWGFHHENFGIGGGKSPFHTSCPVDVVMSTNYPIRLVANTLNTRYMEYPALYTANSEVEIKVEKPSTAYLITGIRFDNEVRYFPPGSNILYFNWRTGSSGSDCSTGTWRGTNTNGAVTMQFQILGTQPTNSAANANWVVFAVTAVRNTYLIGGAQVPDCNPTCNEVGTVGLEFIEHQAMDPCAFSSTYLVRVPNLVPLPPPPPPACPGYGTPTGNMECQGAYEYYEYNDGYCGFYWLNSGLQCQ